MALRHTIAAWALSHTLVDKEAFPWGVVEMTKAPACGTALSHCECLSTEMNE